MYRSQIFKTLFMLLLGCHLLMAAGCDMLNDDDDDDDDEEEVQVEDEDEDEEDKEDDDEDSEDDDKEDRGDDEGDREDDGKEDRGDDDEDKQVEKSRTLEDGLNIRPSNPVVSDGGSIELDVVLLEGESPVEPTAEDDVSIEWSVDDEFHATVSEQGGVRGENPGSTEVRAQVHYEGQEYEQSVDVEVVSVSTAGLFLNPRSAIMNPGESKVFNVTAVDEQGTPTTVDDDAVDFRYDEDFLKVERDIDRDVAQITLEAKNRAGYTYVIPVHREGDAEITGDPVLIHIQNLVQPQQPQGEYGGASLDFIVDNLEGGGELMHTAHVAPGSRSDLYFETFDLTSQILTPSQPSYGGGEIRDLTLHRFPDEAVRVVLRMDDELRLLRSMDDGDSWYGHKVLKELDYQAEALHDSAKIGNYLYVMVHGGGYENSLEIMQIDISSDEIENRWNVASDIDITGLDLQGTEGGNAVFAFTTPAGLFYGWLDTEEDNGKTPIEKVVGGGSYKYPNVVLDSTGSPYVVAYDEAGNRIERYRRDVLGWSSRSITSTDFRGFGVEVEDILGDVASLSVLIDERDTMRITLVDGDNVYYVRDFQRGRLSGWRIDQINEDNIAGDSARIAMNRWGRALIFYEEQDIQWLRFWSEPLSVDYREFPEREEGGIYQIEDTWSHEPLDRKIPFDDVRVDTDQGEYRQLAEEGISAEIIEGPDALEVEVTDDGRHRIVYDPVTYHPGTDSAVIGFRRDTDGSTRREEVDFTITSLTDCEKDAVEEGRTETQHGSSYSIRDGYEIRPRAIEDEIEIEVEPVVPGVCWDVKVIDGKGVIERMED
ncbi:Ig-like domain-containing protein [Halorhodospira halochloris]|uniref:Ig-like domain-containing protein n=1 Tax=Halorhodospira halochloris TaxID=1052 RepID=UPI001EE8C6D1|nr:Ig-like domain-containing protein [Halorhodospira halochloris]MCG5547574.1 Ig-like domain-containing protein [Halorhodospira halochloris]